MKRINQHAEEIAVEIRKVLMEIGVGHAYQPNKGEIRFETEAHNQVGMVRCEIRVRSSDYSVYTYSPVCPGPEDSEALSKLAEFFCRANYGLRNGRFEMDMRDGEIRFHVFVDCDGQLPSRAVILNSVFYGSLMFEIYGNQMLRVMRLDTDPASAIFKCEGNGKGSLMDASQEETEVMRVEQRLLRSRRP